MVDINLSPIKKSPRGKDKASAAKLFEEEMQSLKNQLARAMADYQNLEKRLASDKENRAINAVLGVLTEILPILDTIKAARKANPADPALPLFIKQFESSLERLGVTPIQAAGQSFDPATMECLEVVAGEPENTVAQEITPGYNYRDRLIRPATVRVYQKETPITSPEEVQTN